MPRAGLFVVCCKAVMRILERWGVGGVSNEEDGGRRDRTRERGRSDGEGGGGRREGTGQIGEGERGEGERERGRWGKERENG